MLLRLSRRWLVAALAVVVAAPAAHASSNVATFTRRAEFLAAVAARGDTPRAVDIANATSPTSIDGFGFGAPSGTLALIGAAGAHSLGWTPGTSPNTFEIVAAPGTSALGFRFTPGATTGPIAISALAEFNGIAITYPISVPFAPIDPVTPDPLDGSYYMGFVVEPEIPGGCVPIYGCIPGLPIHPGDATEILKLTATIGGLDGATITHVDYSDGVVPTVAVLPEPTTVALAATGLLALGGIARRRRSRA